MLWYLGTGLSLPYVYITFNLFSRRSVREEPDDLETPEEKSERWVSIRIIYFTMFLMSLGFSIILTGVWPYLDKASNICSSNGTVQKS